MDPIKRGVAFALFVPLILISVAHSEAAASLDYFMLQFSKPAANRSADSPAGPVDATPASSAPEPEALRLANQIVGRKSASTLSPTVIKGGLWVSGDVTDALARLRWIIGPENEQLLSLEAENRVTLDAAKLTVTAKADEDTPDGTRLQQLASYITANEGLLLLLQITEGSHRYKLHIGQRAPTAGGETAFKSALNLDQNFDSRINPIRRNGLKLLTERPPVGFDSLVAINPTARWFNLRAKLLVPPGNLTLHELAEAYAKVEFGFDYLPQGSCPGAHDIAIEREVRLMAQRPFSCGVITKGENRVSTTPGEVSLSNRN